MLGATERVDLFEGYRESSDGFFRAVSIFTSITGK